MVEVGSDQHTHEEPGIIAHHQGTLCCDKDSTRPVQSDNETTYKSGLISNLCSGTSYVTEAIASVSHVSGISLFINQECIIF